MFAKAFDLVIADVEASYSRHVSQADADIGRTLRRLGSRGSEYACEREDFANLSSATNALEAHPWSPAPICDIRALRFEQWSDLKAFMKEPG